MSTYAKVNLNNIVENVIIADSSYILSQEGMWIEVTTLTGPANGGQEYSSEHKKFIPEKPFESWIFDEDSFEWVSPAGAKPSSGYWSWNELDQEWTELISELSEE